MGLELTINLNLTIFSRETKHIVKSRSYCTINKVEVKENDDVQKCRWLVGFAAIC